MKTQKKKSLVTEYIQLITSISGFSVEKFGRPIDNSGIDVMIIAPGEIEDVDSPRIDAQVKCTSVAIETDNCIKYDLKVNNYNKLIKIKSLVPKILIVVLVPRNINEWIGISEQQTLMKKCGYWISLKGKKPVSNTGTVRREIPKENLFTPEAISQLMQEAAEYRAKLFDYEKFLALEEQIEDDSA